jgi:hypothetical protein
MCSAVSSDAGSAGGRVCFFRARAMPTMTAAPGHFYNAEYVPFSDRERVGKAIAENFRAWENDGQRIP